MLRKITRLIGVLFAGAALAASVAFLGGVVPASAASSTAPSPAPSSSDEPPQVRPLCRNLESGAPCGVNGYSIHAQYRMAQRGISQREVEEMVWAESDQAFLQANGNWRYVGDEFTVILNNDAWCVTVF